MKILIGIGIFIVFQKSHGRKLPEWGEKVIGKLQQLDALMMKIEMSTVDVRRLRSGPLLNKFLENMKSKSNHVETPEKVFLYSAHDSTLVRLMSTLNIFDPLMPPYSAALIVELHRTPHSINSHVKVK